jgi:hypothetical protein
VFVQTFTEKLMTYAVGRAVDYYDMPAVRKIIRDAGPNNYKFSSIVTGIIRSAPFQMRMKLETTTESASVVPGPAAAVSASAR